MSRRHKPAIHPSEYLIPASDSKGHAVLYQFRAPEDWGRRMEELVLSRKFPFGTPSDIMRWCWFEGMSRLTQLEPECTDLAQITAAIRVVRDAEEQQRFVHLFDRTQRVIDTAIAESDEGTARQLVADLRYQFERMPDGTIRDRYLKKLEQWNWLLSGEKGVAPVSLAPPKRVRRPKVQHEDEE